MGTMDQNRFLDAVRAGSGGDWSAAARALGRLEMFDVLPALAQLDEVTWAQVSSAGRGVLGRAAFERIEFAKTVVSRRMMVSAPSGLHEDQVDDVRRYLLATLRSSNSRAGVASFSDMDAAAIQALEETGVLTRALQREFSGSIYAEGAGYGFTPPEMAGMDWSPSQAAVPKGTRWVGTYHAHPAANPDAESFSAQDIVISRGIMNGSSVLRPPLVNYLGTPSGRIKKLTPCELLPSAEAEAHAPDGKREVLR